MTPERLAERLAEIRALLEASPEGVHEEAVFVLSGAVAELLAELERLAALNEMYPEAIDRALDEEHGGLVNVSTGVNPDGSRGDHRAYADGYTISQFWPSPEDKTPPDDEVPALRMNLLSRAARKQIIR